MGREAEGLGLVTCEVGGSGGLRVMVDPFLGGKRGVYDTRNADRCTGLGSRHRGRVQWAKSKGRPAGQ